MKRLPGVIGSHCSMRERGIRRDHAGRRSAIHPSEADVRFLQVAVTDAIEDPAHRNRRRLVITMSVR